MPDGGMADQRIGNQKSGTIGKGIRISAYGSQGMFDFVQQIFCRFSVRQPSGNIGERLIDILQGERVSL